MKKLLFVFFLFSGALFAQPIGTTLTVNIQSGNLNIRKSPDATAEIVGKAAKGGELIFQMKFLGDWLFVKCCTDEDNEDNYVCAEGWVSRQYVDCSYFHSSMLEEYQWTDEEFGTYIYGVSDPLMMIISDTEAHVYHKGKKVKLSCADGKGMRYTAGDLSVEVILTMCDVGYESRTSSGFLRVSDGVKVEYVFVMGEYGT